MYLLCMFILFIDCYHLFFFFNDTATTEIYTYCHTLSLHDALPIYTNAHTIDSLSRVVGGRDWKGNDGDSLRRDAAMQRPDTHPSPKLEPAVKADEPVVSRPAEDGLQLAGRYPAEDLPLQPV